MVFKVCFGRRDEFWAIGSQIVMAFEQTKYSHAWIEIGENVFESIWPKSRMIAKKDHHYTVAKEFMIYIDDSKASDLMHFVYKLMDRKYSLGQLAVMAFGNIIGLIGQKISLKENFNGKSKLVCTELCARVLSEFMNVDFGESFDTVGINDLYYECMLIEKVQGGYK